MRIRASVPALVAGSLFMLMGAPTVEAFRQPERPGRPELDVRLPAAWEERGGFTLREPTLAQLALAERLASESPGLTLRWDGMSGSPKWISASPGSALSAADPATPERAARAFLRSRAALFGLRPPEVDRLEATAVVRAPDGGARVYFTQRFAGFEVFGGRANVNLRADGSVRSVGSSLYADATAPGLVVLEPGEALRLALEDVYPDLALGASPVSAEPDGERRTVFDGEGFGRAPEVRLVLFPRAEGAALAWEVRVAERTRFTDYRVLIDAVDGGVLHRRNVTRYAEARVLTTKQPDPQTEEARPEQHRRVPIPASTPESPLGWISGDGTSLDGNNATTHLGYWNQAGLADPAGLYDYRYNTHRAALVNAWYWVNDTHDRFYALGFDEAAGNYQTDNFGQGGAGGDPMRVVYWIHGDRSTAFYTPSVDGGLSTVNFFWSECIECGDHDGYPENGGERSDAFMADVVVHEYVHGVTIRMVGGPADDTCLSGIQSGGMGEGWSDLLPASFFGDPRTGDHFYEGSGWLRAVEQDLTYDHLCQVGDYGCIVHHEGQIWGATLWELRRSMIALEPAGGLDAFHRIVVQGLASTACNPTMLDARDGILDADTALFGGAHHTAIWNAFAARRMGNLASSTGDMDTTPVTDGTVPASHACAPPAAPALTSATPDGANAVRLDYTATGAAAVEIRREEVGNLHDRPVLVGRTVDASTFTDDTVEGGKTYRYHLVALGEGGVSCSSAASGTADATATGDCDAFPMFNPGLTVTDGAADCSVTLSWAAASAGCPASAEPIVYNVYASDLPGFEPSDRNLVARTSATSVAVTPARAGRATVYLVLAQHGTPDDPPDHRDRGSAQVLQWRGVLSTQGRTLVQEWTFDSGNQGWFPQNFGDPNGPWTRVDPSPTFYAGTLLAPDEAAGGSGAAWVTGDAGGASPSLTAFDCDGWNTLRSPQFNGTDGATILSFDYWSHLNGRFNGGISMRIDSGSGSASLRDIGLMTVQRFETDGRHGWQRYEVDLAQYVTPTTSMNVTFTGYPDTMFSEYGIDNVRLERATLCSRSNLEIVSATVDDSPAGWGNGNGLPEPGETVRLTIDLTNSGSDDAVTPVGDLVGLPAGVLAHQPTDDFPTLTPSATGSSLGNGFMVTLPESGCEDSVTFTLKLTDANGTTSFDTFTLEYGTFVTETVFQDDLESDPGSGWIVSGAGAGDGIWQWGDPVGTLDGAAQANPEDCADGPGTSCFVTENGSPGADAGLTDLDTVVAVLDSPKFDLSGYKRMRMSFDHWHYDNGTVAGENYSSYGARVDDGELEQFGEETRRDPTTGWVRDTIDLTPYVPSVPDVRVRFRAEDRDQSDNTSWADDVVEVGVDNVLVEGDLQVCAASGVNPPNGVGDTLRVTRSGGDLDITWTASPTDATHDTAVYYRLHVSAAPDAGFAVEDTTLTTTLGRTPVGDVEYFKVSAANAGGTSGDEPAP